MSKAFTNEEAADPTVAGRLVQRAAPGQERPITPAGHRRLVDELGRLKLEREARSANHDVTREAALAVLDHRLALVSATLASVRVVEPHRDGKVRFGSTVALAWADGRQQTISIVGPDEADAKAGRVQAVVTSAVPLPVEVTGEIAGAIAAMTRQQIVMETKVDPALIGGIVTRVGGTVFDGSVKTQLEQLRQTLRTVRL